MKYNLFTVFVLLLLVSACVVQEDNGINPWDIEETEDVEEITEEEVVEEEDLEEPEEEIVEEIEEPEEELIELYELDLEVEQTDNSVMLTWTKYQGDMAFASYKISRSVIDSNPQYPGHSLRKTIANINETTYTDLLPEPGISYYVVSVLSPLKEKVHSNPVKVDFPNPKETPDQEIKLTAEKVEEGVLLEWDRYNGEFLFYKIVTTTNHPYPKYPDDDTIKTVAYQNETSFIDINPEEGLNYYAVTVVRPDKTRFTSERASIEIK